MRREQLKMFYAAADDIKACNFELRVARCECAFELRDLRDGEIGMARQSAIFLFVELSRIGDARLQHEGRGGPGRHRQLGKHRQRRESPPPIPEQQPREGGEDEQKGDDQEMAHDEQNSITDLKLRRDMVSDHRKKDPRRRIM